jgi:hypothetical protein
MSTTTTNYGLIKPELSDTADITAYNSNWDKIDSELNAIKPKSVTAFSEDGVKYYATINGITELYNGLEITVCPQTANKAINPTLDVNGLGAKTIKLPLSTNTAATTTIPVSSFVALRSVKLMYDSGAGIWIMVDKQLTSANTLYGVVPISKGGTGADNSKDARTMLGITPANIGALPTVLIEGEHYGTELPTPGTKGRIFFKKVSS